MSLNFTTSDPNNLLSAFRRAIDQGHIVTWSYDTDGDFTHTPEQWKHKAWMRPVVYQGLLTMNFIGNPHTKNMREVYGVYHGRLIESMLVHCDKLFDKAAATALATNADRITTAA